MTDLQTGIGLANILGVECEKNEGVSVKIN